MAAGGRMADAGGWAWVGGRRAAKPSLGQRALAQLSLAQCSINDGGLVTFFIAEPGTGFVNETLDSVFEPGTGFVNQILDAFLATPTN